MGALAALWSVISVAVVALIGAAVAGPVGFVIFPVAAMAVAALKARHDRARLESLRQATAAAQAEAVVAQEQFRVASARLAAAVEARDQLRESLRADGWYLTDERDVSLN